MGLKPVTTADVEAATIELTLDGEIVQAKEGVSLYDVVSSTGKIVPAMCYHYTFDPFGSCGMCLVLQEGKKAPVRSCTAKAAAGMVIQTEGEELFLAQKKSCGETSLRASVGLSGVRCRWSLRTAGHGLSTRCNQSRQRETKKYSGRYPQLGARFQHEPLHRLRRMYQYLQRRATNRCPAIYEKGRVYPGRGKG